MSASREKRLRREQREAETGDNVKKVKKKKKANPARAKKIRGIVGTVIGVVLVIVFALLIIVNSGMIQKNATALTVGSHKISPAEFNYFYQDTYSNMKSNYSSYWSYMVDSTKPIASQECMMSDDGSTWGEYIRSTAIKSAVQTYALYDAAQEAGYTIDEDAQSTIDSLSSNISSYATSNKYDNADDYLESLYGKGATVDSYVNYVTVQQYASGYATEKKDSFSYSDDDLRSYYDDNKQTYDKVNYRIFTVTTTNDDSDTAKSTADSMYAELDGTEKSFSDAAYKYATDDEKDSYKDEDYTLRTETSYSSLDSSYADWLFSADRVAGESEVAQISSGYVVIMFVSRDENDYNTVNVRHILIKVATSGDNSTSTDDDWSACKEKIDDIEKQWEATDQTEDDFAKLAEDNSEDTGSSSNGGLYEGVYKGQMETAFNDWCFDSSRKVGDTGIVKTSYGYHLMYFSGTGDEYWKTLADSGKRSEDYNSWYDDYSANYEGKSSAFWMLFTYKTLAA